MKVILNKDVYNLGEEGDVCDVARGYARNYLLPQKLAVLHTNENISYFESRRGAIEKRKEEKRKLAKSLKERIEDTVLTIKMSAGDTGKLFGAVTNATISNALAKEGIEIERKNIDVPSNSIKMLGNSVVKVKLYESELADLQVQVVDENEKKNSKTETDKTEKMQEKQPDHNKEENEEVKKAESTATEAEKADDKTSEIELSEKTTE
ncbi:MAG: 50S ribosomal protein L9 [Spirochaetia bacterium]|nr:50S ribosomal protein L9 [Spirochaetia bacterium]